MFLTILRKVIGIQATYITDYRVHLTFILIGHQLFVGDLDFFANKKSLSYVRGGNYVEI